MVGGAPALPRSRRGHVRGGDRLGAHAHRPGRLRPQPLGLGDRDPRPGRRISCPARSCAGTSGSAPSTTRRSSTSGTGSGSTTSWWRATTPTPTPPGPTPRPFWPEDPRPPARRRTAEDRRRQRGRGCSATRSRPPTTGGPMIRATAVVDADGHVVEPRSAWDGRARASTGPGSRPTATATSTSSWATPRSWPCPWGPWPPRGRASRSHGDLPAPGGGPARGVRPGRPAWPTWTAEGIDQAVLYPSVGLYSGPSTTPRPPWPWPAPTTTGWPATAPPPDRLFGAAMLPDAGPGGGRRRAAPGPSTSSASPPPSSGPTPAGAGRCPTPPTARSGGGRGGGR